MHGEESRSRLAQQAYGFQRLNGGGALIGRESTRSLHALYPSGSGTCA